MEPLSENLRRAVILSLSSGIRCGTKTRYCWSHVTKNVNEVQIPQWVFGYFHFHFLTRTCVSRFTFDQNQSENLNSGGERDANAMEANQKNVAQSLAITTIALQKIQPKEKLATFILSKWPKCSGVEIEKQMWLLFLESTTFASSYNKCRRHCSTR